MKNLVMTRLKTILFILNGFICILYVAFEQVWIHEITSICVLIEIAVVLLFFLLSYVKKDNRMVKLIGIWIFILPASVIPKLYGLNFLEPQTTLLLISFCIGTVIAVLSYKVSFHNNLIETILIIGIFSFGTMGAIVDFNVTFDQGAVYEAKEIVIEKEQQDTGKTPELLPFLYITVDSMKYGKQNVTVSKKVFEKYEKGDYVPFYVHKGALGMSYMYIEHIPVASIYRSLDNLDV